MYAVIYGDNENGENIEIEGLFQTHAEAVKALYESASKSFNSMNIDIESCVDDEYDWSPRGEIHKESAWANSGGHIKRKVSTPKELMLFYCLKIR